MRAVLCQIRDDVSDREAARRAAKDLDWKRALGIEADEIPFHHTTLSVFRSRLLVNDADGVVLTRTVERAVAAGVFAKKVLAIADSTGVMGAAAVADTYELLRQAIAKLIGAAGGPKALPARLRKRARVYVRGKADIDWADRQARRDGTRRAGLHRPRAARRSRPPTMAALTHGSCWNASSTKTSTKTLTMRAVRRSVRALPPIGSCRWLILRCDTAARAIRAGSMATRRTCSPNTITSSCSPSVRHRRMCPTDPKRPSLVTAAQERWCRSARDAGRYRLWRWRHSRRRRSRRREGHREDPTGAATGKFLKTDFAIDPTALRTLSGRQRDHHCATGTGQQEERSSRSDAALRARALHAVLVATAARRARTADASCSTPTKRDSKPHAPNNNDHRSNTSSNDERSSNANLPSSRCTAWARPATAANAKCCSRLRLTATLVNIKKLFTLEIPTLHPAMHDRIGAARLNRVANTTTSRPTTPPKTISSAAT